MIKLLHGNVFDVLCGMDTHSVDCIVTSPPYWSLRNYNLEPQIWGGNKECDHQWDKVIQKPKGGKGSKCANISANANDFANMRDHNVESDICSLCGAWKGNLGLEPTLEMYINNLCNIFDECYRVLKDTGTCFIVLGDTYISSGGPKIHFDYTDPMHHKGRNINFPEPSAYKQNVKPKSLAMIPSRVGIELTQRGWILRNKIIWHKPNAMPCSVKDRFTVDYEEVLFLTKKQKGYFFEKQYEPVKEVSIKRSKYGLNSKNKNNNVAISINTDKLGTRFVNPEKGRNKRTVWNIPTKGTTLKHYAAYPDTLIEPMLKAGCPEYGIVLDPFIGIGTTAIVASQQKKHCIGIDLSEEYLTYLKNRKELEKCF